MSAPAIVVLTRRGLGLAERIRTALPGSEVHGPSHLACATDRSFARVGEHLAWLFREGRPIVGLCASGILIRALGPLLADKRREPPVLAVAEDGSSVVPLLGGHRGGNALARAVAASVGAHAALTTAGDVVFDVALDEPPPGWRLAEPESAKAFMARLLDGARTRLVVESGDATWLRDARLPLAEDGELEVLVTHRRSVAEEDRLVYHPPVLAIGVGTERGAAPKALRGLVEEVLDRHQLATSAVAGIFSIDLKADEPAVHALAGRFAVPARFLAAEELQREVHRLVSPSELVAREVGVAGVAEAAALAAAGPAGRLLVAKTKGCGVTCAIALAPRDIAPGQIGRRRGRLLIVGIGPGDRASRTQAVEEALAEAEDVVGYGLYLDLVRDLIAHKAKHPFPLGEEQARCRAALDLAAEGRTVALVSSGDAGIYAMAALVFELLEREASPARSRVAVEVVPGVSAMQAAAARAGAPLGHDFCAISLSDLLTPVEAIRRRLEAAAVGDFVVALYNPVSNRRRGLLAEARAILLRHRRPDTPVLLARNLGRPGETCRTVPLAELDAAMADMLTVIIVGSSATRSVPRRHGEPWLYTPRGYRLA